MRNQALHSPLRKQIDYSASPEVVSSDFVGSRHACIFDAQATIVNGKQAVLYLWYDNEFGYSCQVHRILEQMAGIDYAVYPQAGLSPAATGSLGGFSWRLRPRSIDVAKLVQNQTTARPGGLLWSNPL